MRNRPEKNPSLTNGNPFANGRFHFYLQLQALSPMPDIVLTTLNAKYIHSAFGLRYLMANLGELQNRAILLEFDIHQRPLDIVEKVLQQHPQIVGFGVYIWNATQSLEVVTLLKKLRPNLRIILGGPEVSFETNEQMIAHLADYVITGEADLKFPEVCRNILSGDPPADKLIAAPLPDVKAIQLPYSLYTDQDVAHRIVYVEASRGCPFTCEFCLSSLEIPVRQFDVDQLLSNLENLLQRGVRHFKFVDRTFNLNIKTSRAILEFFLERLRPDLFLHFEMIPDRLPGGLREIIAQFPPGTLQFEVGIQTFNPDVGQRIRRRQNYQRLEENFRYLRKHTGVHIHADLIVGLPGETMESFANGFNRLVNLQPQEIQVGILKRLRGTPISRHDQDWQMIYSPHPPYEILANQSIHFDQMQLLRRFARHWDLVGNSGNFLNTLPLLWKNSPSAFEGFMEFSCWLHQQTGQSHSIALTRLFHFVFNYLVQEKNSKPEQLAPLFLEDYQRSGRSDVPVFLRPWTPNSSATGAHCDKTKRLPKRQQRHLRTLHT